MARRFVSVFVLVAVAPLLFAAGTKDPGEVIKTARVQAAKGSYQAAIATLKAGLEAHPDDPAILLELGRTSYELGREAMKGTSSTLGQLALVDAVKWLKKATTVKRDWPEALRLLGKAAVEGGDFRTGEKAWRQVVRLKPNDGESRYQLGYCLAWLGRFVEALDAFDAAEKILGPQPRLLLNRGICQEKLGRKQEAEKTFTTLIEVEAHAGRPGSTEMRGAFTNLWHIYSADSSYENAAKRFRRIAAEFPKVSSGWWYLGHALLRAGKPGPAAEAFAKVTVLEPSWAQGISRLGTTLLAAGEPEAAEKALAKLADLDQDSGKAGELLLSIVKAYVAAKAPEKALAVIDRMRPKFPGDLSILERRADVLNLLGRRTDAIRAYRAAEAEDPFAEDIAVKEQKVVTEMLRLGKVPADLEPLRPKKPPEFSPGKGGTIFDFEGSGVFARVNGAATGGRSRGGFELSRTDPRQMATLSLTFIPTTDTRPYASLRFRVKGPKGKALLVMAQDCYDEFSPSMVRLGMKKPVELTGQEQTVTLPLDGFVVVNPKRPIPMNRARLRALVFAIGMPGRKDVDLADRIWIDDVAFVAKNGKARIVESFDGTQDEALFLSVGAASAFAPTLFSPKQLSTFHPDPNTYVTPAIFGRDFDKADVHSGSGSFRLTVTRDGPASGELTFNPDRSFYGATAITFFAKGRAGGERLRVTFTDALDASMGFDRPVAVPRLETKSHVFEGWFRLTPEWKEYRIERKDLVDVDFRSIVKISFEFGTPQGNPIGTTIWIDDIAWK